jgi:LPS-assembly lipoprotein
MLRRSAGTALGLGAAAALTACGFALRGQQNFAFRTLYSSVAESSPVGVELRRQITSGGDVQWLSQATQRAGADVVLDLLSEQREKVVVGVNASGQVREFQLRLRISFRLSTPQGRVLIPNSELLLQRDISFNESAVLGKEAEEALLYREMQSDAVQQILRRLAAVRSLT